MRINLGGEWQFKQAGDQKFYKAKVPGCNYLDLMENGLIPDPFYGTNEKDVRWVSEKDWLYVLEFEVKADLLAHQSVCLVCESLDTVADVILNGEVIKNTDNCHIVQRLDITNKLKADINKLEILFHSPVKYVEEHQALEKFPHNFNGLTGIPHIRKPQCHFGWDWGPQLAPSGISGDIYLEAINIARIKNLCIYQNHTDGKVDLKICGELDNYIGKDIGLIIDVITPDGNKLINEITAKDKFEAELTIDKPELWWTKELSAKEKQPLYTVSVSVKDRGNAVNTLTQRIGLRTVKLNQARDEYGKNFQFVLNGVPIFAKGANWIPADSFINRVDYDKLLFYVKTAVDSNFNMLRIWGGGYYGSDTLYDLCDEYGILIWQDFGFACQPYPFFNKAFLDNVYNEIADNVIRLRNHASLCLWCGNNEIEAMSVGWKNKVNFIKWTKKFFYELLPVFLQKYDNVTDYISGTPCGIDHCKGVNNDNVGDTHLWAVWHGLQPVTYYRRSYDKILQ